MGMGNIENSLLPFSRIIFSILDPYFMKGAILCLLWRLVFWCWNSSLKNYQEKTLTTNRNSRVCNVPRDPPSSWFCTLKTLQGMESVLWWSMHTNYSLRSVLTLPTLSTCSQPQSKCLHCRVGKRVLKTLRSSIWKKTMASVLNFKERHSEKNSILLSSSASLSLNFAGWRIPGKRWW